MHLRFRALKGRIDLSSFWAEYKARHHQDREELSTNAGMVWLLLGPFAFLYLLPLAAGLRLFGLVSEVFTGAKEIDAREGAGDVAQLEAMLRRGELKSSDLVLMDGSWQTFQQAIPFEEVCFELERQARPFQLAAWVLSIVVGLLLVLGLTWFVCSIPGWIMDSAR